MTPNNKKILIDGGRDKSAYELLCRKYSLGKNNNKIEFEAIYLTHADQDHADGLIPILESSDIKINKLYHNGIMKYKYDKKKVEIKTEEMTEIGPKVKAGSHEYLKGIKNNLFDFDREIALSARSRKLLDAITYGLRDNKSYRQLSKFRVRVKIRAVLKAFFNRDLMSHVISDEEKNRLERLDSDFGVKYEEKISIERSNKEGEIFPVEQKLEIRILGPIRPLPELAYNYIVDESKTINGNSVSMLLTYDKFRLLLCGDMNNEFEDIFIDYWDKQDKDKIDYGSQVFKANHHGSHHFTIKFLQKVKPSLTVISAGYDPDHGHPRGILLGSVGKYAPKKTKQPIVLCTKLGVTYKKIRLGKMKKWLEDFKIKLGISNVYQKMQDGIIYVKSDGQHIMASRIYNRTNWESYYFDIQEEYNKKTKMMDYYLTGTAKDKDNS